MSITSGIFKAEDDTEIKVSAVTSVSPLVGSNGSSYYDITYQGGRTTVKESYMSRVDFLTAWRTS